MNLPAPVVAWSRAQGHGEITGAVARSGGCIHTAVRLTAASGDTFFLKANPEVPDDMFRREADGLAALAAGGGPRVPVALLAGPDFLLLEDLGPSGPAPDYWERLGQGLARLHSNISPRFGFAHDNYIGLTPQPNPWTDDGIAFFSDHRLRFQARRAVAAGRLAPSDLRSVDRLCEQLTDLLPAQPASLIHGDLWSGNVMPGPDGEPCLIDPACHYGWAEAELGMTDLFGGFPPAFYDAYQEARPSAPGWRQRLPIYNLYHLLNHLNLFGESYLASVRAVLRRVA